MRRAGVSCGLPDRTCRERHGLSQGVTGHYAARARPFAPRGMRPRIRSGASAERARPEGFLHCSHQCVPQAACFESFDAGAPARAHHAVFHWAGWSPRDEQLSRAEHGLCGTQLRRLPRIRCEGDSFAARSPPIRSPGSGRVCPGQSVILISGIERRSVLVRYPAVRRGYKPSFASLVERVETPARAAGDDPGEPLR
jgi:hypothetical protein